MRALERDKMCLCVRESELNRDCETVSVFEREESEERKREGERAGESMCSTFQLV
jgi:hypothetical protein